MENRLGQLRPTQTANCRSKRSSNLPWWAKRYCTTNFRVGRDPVTPRRDRQEGSKLCHRRRTHTLAGRRHHHLIQILEMNGENYCLKQSRQLEAVCTASYPAEA